MICNDGTKSSQNVYLLDSMKKSFGAICSGVEKSSKNVRDRYGVVKYGQKSSQALSASIEGISRLYQEQEDKPKISVTRTGQPKISVTKNQIK